MTQKITIKIDNKILEGFDNINVSRNIEEFCGTFSFDAYSEKNIILPFNPSDSCEILVDGETFLTGIIDSDFIGYDNTTHSYNFSGRDKTSMIVDNSAEGNLNFTSPISITDIILKLVSNFSTDIIVIPPLESIDDFSGDEIPAEDEGGNLFQFIEKLARQRGLLLRTNEFGDIVLEKKQGAKYGVKLISEINGINNNIKSGFRRREYSGRYSRYKVNSQSNLSSLFQAAADLNVTGIYTDNGPNVNQDKFLEVEAEISGNQTSNTNRAEWEGKIRAARSFSYSYTVNGFTAEIINGFKYFWNINRLLEVKDDSLDLEDTMLIKSVNFNYTNKTGAITTLELVDKNSYIIGSE